MKKIIKKILYKVFTPILNKINSVSLEFESRLTAIEKTVLESTKAENNIIMETLRANQSTITTIQANSNTMLANHEALLAAVQEKYNNIIAAPQVESKSLQAANNAMFLWLLFGIDIKSSINNSKSDLWTDYLTVFNREREFDFYNSVPIEILGEFAKDYKKCFVAGHFSDLVVSYLKGGHFLIPSSGVTIDTKSECGHLSPIASIPYLMGNEELFLSCNPDLSNLFLSSNSILSFICEKTSELCVLPINISIPQIEIIWEANFSTMEREVSDGVERYWRWAVGFTDNNSYLTIYNNSNENLKVSLRFSLSCFKGEATVVLRDINGQSLSILLTEGSESVVVYDIELFSGKNDLIFNYEGEKHKSANDDRELKFCVANFAVISHEGVTLCSFLSAYDYSIVSVDKEIRMRIKEAGFYAVGAEIIDNKGFYRKNLGNSSFSLIEKDIFVESGSGDIIREAVKSLGKLDLFVVYKCYRKCIPEKVINL